MTARKQDSERKRAHLELLAEVRKEPKYKNATEEKITNVAMSRYLERVRKHRKAAGGK